MVTAARRKALFFKPCHFLRREYACVKDNTQRKFLTKHALVSSLQSQPGIKIKPEEGGAGVSKYCYSSELQRDPPHTPSAFHWMYRISLSFRPKRVLHLSKRHCRDLMYISWYRSTTSADGASIFGTVIGSPTI